jgi:UDP-GlcNAc:undecaprenyl-phosphate/decaprenyl-phosphate GlcNAc-1-phosphate transferase
MIIIFSFIIAMFVTMLLIPPLMAGAERLRIVDHPGERKVHAAPMPRVGGIAMIAGALLPVGMWLMDDPTVLSYVLAVSCIMLFGIWDDRSQLDHRTKFIGQIIATLLVIFMGNVLVVLFPFAEQDGLPYWAAVPFTVFALVGVTNAINLSDGLDGLAGGTTLLSVGTTALLAFMASDYTLVAMCLAVMGSIMGFLRYNTYPARVFMGDSGSQFLGFSAGLLVILLTQKANTALSPAIVLLLLGLPIVDTLVVMAERVRMGRSPFSPDKNHIHHKLLTLGFDHYEAVFIIYLVQAALVTLAFFLRYDSSALILGIFAGLCVFATVFFRVATARGWRAHKGDPAEVPTLIRRQIHWLRDQDAIGRTAQVLAGASIFAAFLLSAALAASIGRDIGWAALAILVVMLVVFAFHHGRPFVLLERAGLYMLGSIVTYIVSAPGTPALAQGLFNVLVLLVLVAVLLAFRFANDRRFTLTPLDFLVIFIVLVGPNLPGTPLNHPGTSLLIAKMIVFFYGCELVVARADRANDMMRFAMYGTLGIIAARALLT